MAGDKWIVKIRVPLLTKNEEGKRCFSVGTGVLISPKYVLTARHIFDRPGLALDANEHTEVIPFVYENGNQVEGEKIEASSKPAFIDDIEEKDPEKYLDIVILELNEPIGSAGEVEYPSLSDAVPRDQQPFSSNGFPCATAGQLEPMTPFDGEFKQPNPEAKRWFVGVNKTLNNKIEWQGVSGSPLISGSKIYAVLKGDDGISVEGFRAASVHYLMRKGGKFRAWYQEYVCKSPKNDHRHAKLIIKQKIAELLNQKERNGKLDEVGKYQSEVLKSIFANELEGKSHDVLAVAELLVNHPRPWEWIRTIKHRLEMAKTKFDHSATLMESQKSKFSLWQQAVDRAVELGGLLLLLSVKPSWLDERNLIYGNYSGFSKEIPVEDTPFIVVVVSRWLLSGSKLKKLVAETNQGEDIFCLGNEKLEFIGLIDKLLGMDGYNPSKYEKEGDTIEKKIERKMEKLADAVFNKTDPLIATPEHQQPPGCVVYVVSEAQLLIINEHFPLYADEFQGRLQFVAPVAESVNSCAHEGQTKLIDQIEQLALLKNK